MTASVSQVKTPHTRAAKNENKSVVPARIGNVWSCPATEEVLSLMETRSSTVRGWQWNIMGVAKKQIAAKTSSLFLPQSSRLNGLDAGAPIKVRNSSMVPAARAMAAEKRMGCRQGHAALEPWVIRLRCSTTRTNRAAYIAIPKL